MKRWHWAALVTLLVTAACPAGAEEAGLVAHWEFEDGSGSLAAADSAGANTGALVNMDAANAWVAGQVGPGALEFDGVDDRVEAAGLNGWAPTAFTVAFWLKPDTSTNYNQRVGATGGWGQFRFHTRWNGSICCGINNPSRFDQSHLPAGTLELNTWQHFAYTFDNGSAAFYKNGQRLAMGTHDMPLTWTGFTIGADADKTVDGRIDDVRVYDRALSEAEAALLFQSTGRPEIVGRHFICADGTLAVIFSKELDAATAQNELNYTLSGGASVSGAVLQADGKTVVLTTSVLAPDTAYTLTVNNVADSYGNAVVPGTVIDLGCGPVIGIGDGLTGVYHDNINFTGTTVERHDPTVDFDWGYGEPAPSIGADTFSVRWTGKVQPHVTGAHTFYTQSDDGIRLWVGGRLVVDDWSDHGVRERSGKVTLFAGEKYPIRIEYYENGGNAVAKLLWESPSIPKAVIPQTQLYTETISSLAITSPLTSATSPVWVEGDVSEAAESVWVSVDGATPYEAVPECPYRWYADSPDAGALGIPLNQASPSASVTVESRDGSGVMETVTETITWTVTDLTGKSASTDSITIRKGDSLLLTATGTGELTIYIDGALKFTGASGATFAAAYETSGVFTTVAKIDGSEVGSLAVTVVDVTPVLPIGVMTGKTRLKTLQVSPAGVLGPPPEMVFVPSDLAMLDVAVDSGGADSVTLALDAVTTGTTSLQARIGSTTGPVVLDQEVHAFELDWNFSLAEPLIKRFSDGDLLIGSAIKMEPRYDGHRLRLYIFAGGTLFEEMGTTELFVSTSDFDQSNQHTFYMVKGIADTICKTVEVADEE